VTRALLCILLPLVACRDESTRSTSPPVPARPEPIALPDAAPDAALETLKEHMGRHFSAISELQRAIARGHLDEAKQLAAWIETHAEVPQPGWEASLDQLHAAAGAVAAAPDVPSAASLAARLGRACSTCHEAREAIVTFAWEPAPVELPTLAAQMKRHQWAAARLWDGLVGPSDQLWSEGAQVLATTRLDESQVTAGPRGDVTALAQKVREIARRAAKVEDHDARTTLYGELLSTCAGCHALVRPAPVPGP
jgi:hypothetical protein